MSRRPLMQVLATCAVACCFVLGATALGLAVNAVRTQRLPLIAPFPYAQDCPEKFDPDAAILTAAQALSLARDRGVAFVDARPREDFDREHLPQASSLPLSISSPLTAGDVAALKHHRLVIVYCDSPDDGIARLQAMQLQRAGLAQVKVLAGGLHAWRTARARGDEGGARR